MQPAAGPWRAVRAAVVATVCVACSVSAHVLAGGGMPARPVLVGSWIVAATLAFVLSRRRWTFGRLLLVLGGGQLVLHPVFEMAGGSAMSADAVMAVAHACAAVVLAAVMAHGDLTLWRLSGLVRSLLAPLATCVRGIAIVPLAAAVPRPLAAVVLDLPAPPKLVVGPSAERAPPKRSH